MQLIDCTVFIVRLPLRRSHNWASKMRSPIGHHAIVRLTADEGLVGWGEAPAGITWGGPAMRYFGETPETVRHLISDYLFPAISGSDPQEVSAIHRRMDKVVSGHPYAKAALDMACYDLAGRALGVPASTLLGGRLRDRVEITHSLGIMELERCLTEAEQAVSEGATTIKCKTGLDAERDVELVRRLRGRLGDEVKIRVDANQGYETVPEAVRATERQEEFDLLLCEEPVSGAVGLGRVAKRIATPVMADESAWTSLDVLDLYSQDAAPFISCYVTKPGGLYHAVQQGNLAGNLGMRCDVGGSIESGIGTAANLQLASALASATLPSVCSVSKPANSAGPDVFGVYYTDDLIAEPLSVKDGHLLVPEGPGLGIEVDESKVLMYEA